MPVDPPPDPVTPAEHLGALERQIDLFLEGLAPSAGGTGVVTLTAERAAAIDDIRLVVAGARGSAMAFGVPLAGLNLVDELVLRMRADMAAGLNPHAVAGGVVLYGAAIRSALNGVGRTWSPVERGDLPAVRRRTLLATMPSEQFAEIDVPLRQLFRGVQRDARDRPNELVGLTDQRKGLLADVASGLGRARVAAVALGVSTEPIARVDELVAWLGEDLASGVAPLDAIDRYGGFWASIERAIDDACDVWDSAERAALAAAPIESAAQQHPSEKGAVMHVELAIQVAEPEWARLRARHPGRDDQWLASYTAHSDPGWLVDYSRRVDARAEWLSAGESAVGRTTTTARNLQGDKAAGTPAGDDERLTLTIPATDDQANENRLTISRARTEDWHGIPAYDFVLVEATPNGDRVIFDDRVHGPALDGEPELNSMALTALTFSTLCPGDVDDEFFERYTPEAIDWRDRYAEDLAGIVVSYDSLRAEGIDGADAAQQVTDAYRLRWEPSADTEPAAPGGVARDRLAQAAERLGSPHAGGASSHWRPADDGVRQGHTP
jgi:hypothetical protein